MISFILEISFTQQCSHAFSAKKPCAPDPGLQATYQESSATATTNRQDACKSSKPDPALYTDLPDQDLPLSFDHSRLAIAVAGARGTPSGQQSEISTLAHVLHNSLPNLHGTASAQVPGQPERKETSVSFCTEENEAKTEHVLGLGCYSSSSDEET